MSQTDYNVPNASAPAVRAQLNDIFASIATNNSGSTAPATTFPHQWWYDTTTNILKQRNAADTAWINVGVFDQTGGTFTPSGVPQLTLGQATDPESTAFGLVSGERLAAAVPDGPFGPEPTWVNFTTAQRAQGTRYQNTTGHHIQLSYSGSAGGSRIGVVWGPSNIGPISNSWPFKAEIGGQGRISFCQIIPPGWFYAHDISSDQYLHEFRS